MRAINHSLTGALIGLTVADPLLAVPFAITSHFILDAIPHHGVKDDKNYHVSRNFMVSLVVDAVLCGFLVAIIILSRPIHWVVAIICAFLAAAPDLLSINLYYKAVKGLPWSPGRYVRFASKIQWFERPIGAVVEVVWLAALAFCLSFFLRR